MYCSHYIRHLNISTKNESPEPGRLFFFLLEILSFFPFLLMITDGMMGPYSSQDQILIIIIGVSWFWCCVPHWRKLSSMRKKCMKVQNSFLFFSWQQTERDLTLHKIKFFLLLSEYLDSDAVYDSLKAWNLSQNKQLELTMSYNLLLFGFRSKKQVHIEIRTTTAT